MSDPVVCAGEGPVASEPLYFDVRELVLRKLSVRDLARTACACREFHAAYLRRAAEERVALMAAGKDTYGHGIFGGLVRVFQKAMSGLDPVCPHVPAGHTSVVMINAAGEPEAFLGLEAAISWFNAEGCRCGLWEEGHGGKEGQGAYSLRANIDVDVPGQGMVNRIVLEMSRSPGSGVHLKARLSREAPGPAVGVLLAICTGLPETLSPCFRGAVTMVVKIDNLPRTLAGIREAEDVAGPLRLLAESFIIHPISVTTANPLAQKVQARSEGVLKSVTVNV
jgi:hypothetical protein